VTPLLLALGAPVTLLMRTASPGFAAWLRKYGRSSFCRFITFPLAVTVVLIAPFLLIYLTPLYELTLDSAVVGGLVRVALVLAGFLYFYSRVQLDPTPREGSHLVSMWISLTEVVFDGALGLVLWLGPLAASAHYDAVHRDWGPDQRTDQIVGAGVLWIGGDVAGLPFVGALFIRWARDDEKRAKRLDRKLDEEAEAGEAPAKGLWWENDPQLTQRFRRS
jgi:cytochrome c oxidase assembly factor CtaG